MEDRFGVRTDGALDAVFGVDEGVQDGVGDVVGVAPARNPAAMSLLLRRITSMQGEVRLKWLQSAVFSTISVWIAPGWTLTTRIPEAPDFAK